MNKTIIALCSAVLALGFASCKEGGGHMTTTINTSCYTLAVSPTGETNISPAKYTFVFDQSAATMKLAADELKLGTETVKFNTGDIKYSSGKLDMPSYNYPAVFMFSGENVTGKGDVQITDFKGQYTQAAVMNNDSILKTVNSAYFNSEPLYMPMNNTYTVLDFKYGDWSVKTFWPDMIYEAVTFTSYPGMQPDDSMHKQILYRISMNLKDPAKYTADIFVYNGKFGPAQMPSVNFVLKNLPLTFYEDGFKISATNVNPIMLGENTENTRFTFNSFDLVSTDHMCGMQAIFRVAGIYSGQATGTSIIYVK